MITKNEIKILKAFLIKYGMTQSSFARDAGISTRTLYTALHNGKISEKTYAKIVDAMLEEILQREIIKPITEIEEIKETRYSIIIALGITALMILWAILYLFM